MHVYIVTFSTIINGLMIMALATYKYLSSE